MDASAAKFIGAGLAAIGMIGAGIGVGNIFGNFLAGVIAARRTARTLLAISTGLLLTPVLFLVIGNSNLGGGMLLLVWGLAYGGVSVGLMTWMMKAAPGAVEVATALYVGVFNVAIALGAWAGGLVLDEVGLTGNLWLAAGFATIALLLALGTCLAEHRAANADVGSPPLQCQ